MQFDGSEAVARLLLPPDTLGSQIEELVGHQAAEIDYRIKMQVSAAGPAAAGPACASRPTSAELRRRPANAGGLAGTRACNMLRPTPLSGLRLPAGIRRSTPFMQQTLPWILASLSLALLVAAAVLWLLQQRRPRSRPLPTEWTLTARPVFSTDERRVYRQLREALPHHIVLSKLPLVRFCQPTDPQRGALLVRAARLAST